MNFKLELEKRLQKEKPSYGTEFFYVNGMHIVAEYWKKPDGTYSISYNKR